MPLKQSILHYLAISPTQLVVIAILILLLFGGRKIPELMKGLGSGIKEFKKATKDEEEEEKNNNIDSPTK